MNTELMVRSGETPSKKVARHYPLDLLRGLAALGVAAYHFLASSGGTELQSLGTFGVYLFFALSALTMMMVYSHVFSKAIAVADLKSFYWNRISRILPLLAIVSLINFGIGSF